MVNSAVPVQRDEVHVALAGKGPRRAVLVSASDPLAGAPVHRPTTATLSVTVGFASGPSRSFTHDSRAVYSVTAGADLIELFDTNKVRVRADAAPGASGTATVSVGLPVYAAGVAPARDAALCRIDSTEVSPSRASELPAIAAQPMALDALLVLRRN